MSEENPSSQRTLEREITRSYGLLLTQRQLAELLGRTVGGLRYSLSRPPDARTSRIRDCARRIGRRVYYPASEIAAIIAGPADDRAPR